MKGEIRKQTFSFPEEEWDERERVYYFGDYVAGLCLYYGGIHGSCSNLRAVEADF